MRAISFLLLMTFMRLLAVAEEPTGPREVTVAQLREAVAGLQGKSDKEQAQEVLQLELTERLSDAQRTPLEAFLRGAEAREALRVLADASEFHGLPRAELPALAAPGRDAQVALLAKTREYVVKTLEQLPNFFATRATENFQGTPKEAERAVVRAKYEPFHAVSRSSVTVLYRDRRETIVKGQKQQVSDKKLRTVGEFGPILDIVFGDAAKGHIYWSHWEQGATGPVAVFRYQVPEEQSNYLVGSADVEHGMQRHPAYHGELTLDPVEASILRVTVEAELKVDDPITTADLAVDYGPVAIGGKTYICPLKSVAVSHVRMVVQELNFNTGAVEGTSLGVPRSYLNEVQFRDYHLFRAETRVLDGFNEGAGKTEPGGSAQ